MRLLLGVESLVRGGGGAVSQCPGKPGELGRGALGYAEAEIRERSAELFGAQEINETELASDFLQKAS